MPLQLKIDTAGFEAGVAKAKAALGALPGEAFKAESAIDAMAKQGAAAMLRFDTTLRGSATAMTAAWDATSGATQQLGRDLDLLGVRAAAAEQALFDMAQADAAFDSLRSSLDPLYAASMRYESAIEQTNAALRAGVITQGEANRVMALAEAQHLGLANSVQRLGGMSENTKFMMRNFAYQINQIGQQGAVTGNYLGALAIQIPDIAAAFGGLGAVLAGGAFAIALSALPGLFGNSKTAAEEMADAIDTLDDALGALRDLSSELQNLDQLRAKYGELDADLMKLINREREYNVARADRGAKDAVDALSGAYGQMLDMIDVKTRGGLNAMTQLRNELGLSANDVHNLKAAIWAVEDAKGFDEQAAALTRVDEILQRSKVSTGDLAHGIRSAALDIRAVEQASSDTEDALDGVVASTNGAAQAARSVVSWWQMANAGIAENSRILARNTDNMGSGLGSLAGAIGNVAGAFGGVIAGADDSRTAIVAMANAEPGAGWLGSAIGRMGLLSSAAWGAAAAVFNAVGASASVGIGGGGRAEGLGGAGGDMAARGAVIRAQIAIAQKAAADAAAGATGGGGSAQIDQTREAYDRLLASLDPVVARSQDMAEATATVDAALAASDITATEHARAMDLIRAKYEQTADAAGMLRDAGVSALDRIIETGKLTGDMLKQLAKDFAFAALKATLLNTVTGANSSMSIGGMIMQGLFPGLDGGGKIGAGGTAMVGERGPELVRAMPGGGAVVTSRVDTARQMQAGPQNVHVTVGVSVDDDGKIQAYVRNVGQAAASASIGKAVETVRRNLAGWNQSLATDGALA